MRFLADRWRRIGARLYLALGFAVFLTLVSGAVGVYYFERSGDLNYQVREESVPSLEASWAAAREAERLRVLGLGLLAEPDSGFGGLDSDSLVESLERLESALGEASGVPALASGARRVDDAAHDLAAVIDDLALNRDALLGAGAAATGLRVRLEGFSYFGGPSDAALSVCDKPCKPMMKLRWSGCGTSSRFCTRPVLTRLWHLSGVIRECSQSAASSWLCGLTL